MNHIINACILLFVLSAANSDLYIGSRTLYGLAAEGKAPRIFARVNRMGVPYASLILCTCFCALVFLNVTSSSAKGKPKNFYVTIKVVHPRCSLRLVRQPCVDFWSDHLDVHLLHAHVGLLRCFFRADSDLSTAAS